MRKLFYTLFLVALLYGCGKDGSMGPQGPKGEQGEQGPVGIPGKEGSVMLHGTGAPASSLGKIGDMYLDKSTTNLYGPKDNSGWGTPLNLKGQNGAAGAKGDKGDKGDTGAPGGKGDKGDKGNKGDKGDKGDAGAAGAAGSKILKGTIAPIPAIGAEGDFYLNTTTGDFYGPKVRQLIGSVYVWNWGTPVNLKGTANVIATPWFGPGSWTSSLDGYRRSKVVIIPQPVLNAVGATDLQTFLNREGTMLVYMKHAGLFGATSLLPVIEYDGGNAIVFSWNTFSTSSSETGKKSFYFNVEGHWDYGIPSSYTNTNNIQLRYVLIPPGRVISGVASVGGRQIAVDELKTMSYEQAGAALGWEE